MCMRYRLAAICVLEEGNLLYSETISKEFLVELLYKVSAYVLVKFLAYIEKLIK